MPYPHGRPLLGITGQVWCQKWRNPVVSPFLMSHWAQTAEQCLTICTWHMGHWETVPHFPCLGLHRWCILVGQIWLDVIKLNHVWADFGLSYRLTVGQMAPLAVLYPTSSHHIIMRPRASAASLASIPSRSSSVCHHAQCNTPLPVTN